MGKTSTLGPGAVIGILGGGQLGRMLAMAAARLGYKCHIYSPPGDNPAFDLAAFNSAASWDDIEALRKFASSVDVITLEFENIPVATVAGLAEICPVYPSAEVLELTQDRIKEKNLAVKLGIKVPDFAAIDSVDDLERHIEQIGTPSVLKTRRLGYDGKGQCVIREGDDLAKAFDMIGRQPAILEAFVPFEKEISVIAARGRNGDFVAYDIPENRHENHILKTSHIPANISDKTRKQALEIAEKLAVAMDYVGVFAVELFVSGKNGDETLAMNEIAPRVHNSGHWTSAACTISQFEQHIRAISGLPSGSTQRHSDAVMQNLLGNEVNALAGLAGQDGLFIEIYGKQEARAGRKMGHVTKITAKTVGN